MSAYWIAHVTVTDPQQYQHYMQQARDAFAQFDGQFLARGEEATPLEGKPYAKHVVIAFRDYQTALACYHSAAYQQAKRQRENAADVMVTIVDGLPE